MNQLGKRYRCEVCGPLFAPAMVGIGSIHYGSVWSLW